MQVEVLLPYRKASILIYENLNAFQDAYIPSVARMQGAKPQSVTSLESRNPPSSPSLRPAGAAYTTLDCGFLKLSYVKSVENVASHDIDIEVKLLLKIIRLKFFLLKHRFQI